MYSLFRLEENQVSIASNEFRILKYQTQKFISTAGHLSLKEVFGVG